METPLEKTGAMQSHLLKAGTEVLQGRFRVIELLGRGGMGDVYLGEQISLGRKVALKTLRDELSTQPGMTERFKREALLLSQVDHPSVVRVIDFGQAETTYVLVMEYVEGENLALAMRPGPFSVDRALKTLIDIAEGLAAIHARGIVHRDLKLDNVLLTQTTMGEKARLLDFGIARLAEADTPGASVTQAGLVLGTPEYIAPEQATGGKLEPRTDVYSFGILAYKLLSGRNPFAGPSAREFMLQHISQEPPPLSSFAPNVPEPLAKLVMSCLAKAPAARPDGGRGLLVAFNDLTQPMPVTPETALQRPAKTPEPVSQPVAPSASAMPKRARWFVVGAAASVLLLALAVPRLLADPSVAKASAYLDAGKPALAMEVIDASKDRNEGALRMLRAEALHQQQKHSDEWYLVSNTPEDGLKKMRPALLAALVTDYPKNDDEDGLRAALKALPKSQLSELSDWASGKYSAAQWGALRWTDENQLKADYVKGYISALESSDCDVLSTAARRLGELGESKAVDPLKKLAASPRKGVVLGFLVRSCGHEEANAALRKLGVSAEP